MEKKAKKKDVRPIHNKQLLGVRAFFITKEKKQPIANLPIVTSLEYVQGENPPTKFVVGKLATDINGYVSFKIPYEKVKHSHNVNIYPMGLEEMAYPVKNEVLMSGGEQVFTIEIGCEDAARLPRENIPSVQKADIFDYKFMPFFTHISYNNSCSLVKDNIDENGENSEELESDCNCRHDRDCDAIIPHFPVEECLKIYQFNKGRTGDGSGNGKKSFKNAEDEILDVTTGIINIYETCYKPLGYSLGDLLHSTPLAPCESVNLGIKNWFREDTSKQSNIADRSESLENEVIRSKSTQEFIKSKMSQHSFNFGLSAAFKIKGVPISASLGYAFGSKKSTAEMIQDINETQRQLSNAYASYKSLVVTETSQSESQDVMTKNITNHNHCHSLTLMYYEVIQNILVCTSLLGQKPGVFVKYDTPCFTIGDILCHRHIFREVLLDMKLAECLNDICLDTYVCDGETGDNATGGNDDDQNCVMVDTLKVTVRVADVAGASSEGNLYLLIEDVDGIQNQYYIPHTPDNKYKKNKTYVEEISISPICVTDIKRVGLNLVGNNNIKLANLKIEYKIQGDPITYYFLFNSGLNNLVLKNSDWWYDETLNPEIPTFEDPEPNEEPPADPDSEVSLSCCLNNLLHHVNCNKHYYYKILWMLEDENQRASRFEEYQNGGISLLDVIVNKPIGVFGDWVVFEAANADMVPATDPMTEEMIIHSPTGNLFSEALLGQCNSCEEIDDSKFWDWTGKTCPNGAPEISLDTLSKYQAIASLQNPLGSLLLSLQDIKDVGTPSSSLATLVQEMIKTNIATSPTATKEVLQDLIKLLENTDTSGSTDPDYATSVQNLLELATKLKNLFETLEGLFGE